MAARPDRLHIALGVLLVLGVGFRLARGDPGAGPAAEATPRAQKQAAPARRPRREPAPVPSRPRRVDTLPTLRSEVTAPGSLPVDRLAENATARGQPARTPIDPSLASVAELVTLPGIGPAMARRIVEERESRGKFASLEDLRRVRGIGPAMSARLAPYVTFGNNGRPSVVTSGAEGPVRNGARGSRRVVRRPLSN